jgi:Flp pilus assembly protein TadG
MGPLNIRRWLTCDRGAELIEFAIVTPLLLLLVFGIANFGLMFQRYEVLTNAAREGARVAALPQYLEPDVRNRVTQYLTGSGLTPSNTTTTYLTPPSINVGGTCSITLRGATVTHTYSFIGLGGIIRLISSGSPGFMTKTLTATALMRFEGEANGC